MSEWRPGDPYGYEMRPLRTAYSVDDALRADAPLTPADALARCPEVAALVKALQYADRMCKLDLANLTDCDGDDFNQAVFDTSERISAALAPFTKGSDR